MCIVNFTDYDETVRVKKDSLISDVIREKGYVLETPCNCVGMCGKCLVEVNGDLSVPSEKELEFISRYDNSKYRLACLTKIQGDVQVRIPKIDISLSVKDNDASYNRIARSSYRVYENRLLSEDKVISELHSENTPLGVAIDIGTTGLSGYLINLISGDVIEKKTILNPQSAYGNDVLSRISYCIDNVDGTGKMKDAIAGGVNNVLDRLLFNRDKDDVYTMVIAGNTTMQHLFAGVNPKPIARSPYIPEFIDKKTFLQKEARLNINRNGKIILLPSASGYIGADILAGVVSTEFASRSNRAIFVDIGTNGEIVVNDNGKLIATSTAAGPALEGMNIACGMRAVEGAIDRFKIRDDSTFELSTISSAEPIGICGSGLIDIMAEMVRNNVVLKTGKFNTKMKPCLLEKLVHKKFYLTETIYISQKDIRQIQLAKGAIATGVSMLLDELDIKHKEVEEVVIAGSFGYHLNIENIMEIGLIPKSINGKVSFVGNSSIEGARLALVDKDKELKFEELQRSMKVLELSTSDKFQEYFIRELGF